jgi:hypothetical protein
MSIEKELLKRMRDVLRGLEETHYDLYWDIQTELDLAPQKREPLSDEEINAIDLPEKQCTIRELVRIIEKAHGIGVNEEEDDAPN